MLVRGVCAETILRTMEAMMITLHCSTCDEQREVRVEYHAGWGFRLIVPDRWVLAMWPDPHRTVGCPVCAETAMNTPEKIDPLPRVDGRSAALSSIDPPVPAPSPESADTVGTKQAEEFRKRFINKMSDINRP